MFLALFLLTSKPQYIVYTFIGIVVLFLTAYLYTRFSRKKKFEIVKEYVSEYRKEERKYAYSIKNLIIEEFDDFTNPVEIIEFYEELKKYIKED